MPLDTFARETAETICGRTNPRLSLEGAVAGDPATSPELAEARKLIPEGKSRRFLAAELLLSWSVEPQRWEMVPFLRAEHETLRKDLLGLPMTGRDGSRLQYVSPRQVEQADRLHQRLAELQERQMLAKQRFERFDLEGTDRKVKDLYDAYALFRVLTFRPEGTIAPHSRAYSSILTAVREWRSLEQALKQVPMLTQLEDSSQQLDVASRVVAQLVELSSQADFTPSKVEPLLVRLFEASQTLARRCNELVRKLFDTRSEILAKFPKMNAEQLRQFRSDAKQVASRLDDAAQVVAAARRSLFDNGQAVRLVPALDVSALKADRQTDDESQPWLSLQALRYGSDAFLADYPQPELRRARESFQQFADAYLDRQDPQRAERFEMAGYKLRDALRALGQSIEPLRENLAIEEKDRPILAITAYPPEGAVDTEAYYNRLDPFFWSWVLDFLALACFGLSFVGLLRRPMFWLAIVVLTAGQIMSFYGFGLRTRITGWGPVTGMFETVVFVALVTALLGLWFTLLPMVWPGLRCAWRMTALPRGWEAPPLDAEQTTVMSPTAWLAWNWISITPRLALMAVMFYVLAVMPYGIEGNRSIISLWPRADVGSTRPSVMDLVTWLVGLGVLLPSVWYGPRAALTALYNLVSTPYSLRRIGTAHAQSQVFHRKTVAIVGAAMAFLVAFIAYYSPLWSKNVGSLMPVLRDPFWLYLHVLTITASYGAGVLAWGLGNRALTHYLFGRYQPLIVDVEALAAAGHRPARPIDHSTEPLRRPPEPCAALAGFMYKAIQVAVVLLAAGMILGGLWADVAWGRFWGWDAKEVWALISLLVYLVILHGRYAGWLGNFGLAVGSLAGATAIIVAWYGVNYFLRSGLHTYAQGGGGQVYVLSFLGLNWIYAAAAWVRYTAQTGGKDHV